ncbi:MAG: hypothetical protein WCW35_12775 [Bacteroidota bacterium]
MKKFHSVLIGLLVVLLTAFVHPQMLPQPSLGLDSNSAAIRFERNVNTYFWNANAQYLLSTDDYFLRMNDNFTSTFIKSQFSSYRDEQNFSLSTSKKVSGPFAIAAEAQSFVLSDNQNLGSSNAGIHSGAVGITYRPSRQFFVTPMIGVRFDKQQLQHDNGMNYRLSTEGDSLEFSDYRAGFSGRFNHSNMENRIFSNNQAAMNIATQFSDASTDSIQVRWMMNRNDFYVPADSNILNAFGTSLNVRARTERIWGVQNILAYEIGSGFHAKLDMNIESRTILNAFKYKSLSVLSAIPFNTTVQEFRLEGGLTVQYLSMETFATAGFQLGERNEKHLLERIEGADEPFQENRARQESRLDNNAYRNSLSTMIAQQLSSYNELQFSGSISLVQYDTPDTINTDDRDELLVNLSLRESHWFSSAFQASVTAEATVAHLVYLSREKSANNNWNRIFRLQPELVFQPDRTFRMFNAFEVLANYTVFDFEALVPSVKSYSYRQVAFLDSTSYDMTRKIGLDMVASVRIFERGELHWQEFSERPLQRMEEVTFSPQVRYSFKGQWYFAVGFRSFAQKRFNYKNNIRQFESTFLSAGPTTRIVIRLSQDSIVEVRGWKEFQHQSGGKIQEFSNMTMNVRYTF